MRVYCNVMNCFDRLGLIIICLLYFRIHTHCPIFIATFYKMDTTVFQIIVALLVEVCHGAEKLLAIYSANNTNVQSVRYPLSQLASCGPQHLDPKYGAVELSNDGATCRPLEYSWLQQPSFVEGNVYLTKIMEQVEMEPPLRLLKSKETPYKYSSWVPFEFDNYSFVEIHFSLIDPVPTLIIDLLPDPASNDRRALIMHIHLRGDLTPKWVVYDSKKNTGAWHGPIFRGPWPFRGDAVNIIKLHVQPTCIQTIVNGEHFYDWQHRLNPNKVRIVKLAASRHGYDVIIHKLIMAKPAVPAEN